MLRRKGDHGRVAVLAAGIALMLSATAATAKNSSGLWGVTSPDGRNRLEVSLSPQGEPSFRVKHRGCWAVEPSPLGLTRDDQDFSRGLRWVETSPVTRRRESYELLSGNRSRVDSVLAQRSLVFSNAAGGRITLDLVASADGVAFRYRFPETNAVVRVMQSERTGFAFRSDARGWMQPYHAAGRYTPAYEDYYHAAVPTDLPSSVRATAAFILRLHDRLAQLAAPATDAIAFSLDERRLPQRIHRAK